MKDSIDKTIAKYGEPIEFTPKGGSTLFITASVQSPVADSLFNDFEVGAFIVYIRVGDVPSLPTKFDRVKVRGQIRAVEEAHEETLRGEPIVYMLRVRG
jgi:hypothetical protein